MPGASEKRTAGAAVLTPGTASPSRRAAAIRTRRMRFASTCLRRLLRRTTKGWPMQLQQRIDPLAEGVHGLPPLNIFRTIRRNEAMTRGFLSLGNHLLRGDGLPARER